MKTFYISTGGYPWFNSSYEDRISRRTIDYLKYEILKLDDNNMAPCGNYIVLNIPYDTTETIKYATTQLDSSRHEFATGEININRKALKDRVTAGVSLYHQTHEYPGVKTHEYSEKSFGDENKSRFDWYNKEIANKDTEALSLALKDLFAEKEVQRKLKELINL